jgi:hypothetical protein
VRVSSSAGATATASITIACRDKAPTVAENGQITPAIRIRIAYDADGRKGFLFGPVLSIKR